MFADKNIIVGITGGIAAYKSAELVSRLTKKSAVVSCIMTKSAQEFITPLTIRTISRNPVYIEMFSEQRLKSVEHIALADKADLFIIVPATANIIGKVACGIADDLLTTTIMATHAPVLFAPAMNVNMYLNPVVQDNISKLQKLGYYVMEPDEGDLACGYQGKGRLAELDKILDAAEELLVKEKPLSGKRVVVTAGPTRESLDPVRFISNHSSGKMGYAIARQALLQGAEVTLISGPVALKDPTGVKVIRVNTAVEMRNTVLEHFAASQIVIKAAAVADYRPKVQADNKIKKQPGDMVIELERNPDILAELGQKKMDQILVGFAAESKDVLRYAADKVKRKNLDFIVANDIMQPGAGFAGETNVVSFVFNNGQVKELPQMSKDAVAREILSEVLRIVNGKE